MVATDPEVIASHLAKHAPGLQRVGLESGATSAWLWRELRGHGLPAVCLDSRHATACCRYMKRGQFPARRRVGPNRVAWVPAEVVAWIEGCPRLDHHHGRPKDDRCAEDHQQFASRGAALPTQDTNP